MRGKASSSLRAVLVESFCASYGSEEGKEVLIAVFHLSWGPRPVHNELWWFYKILKIKCMILEWL